MAIFNKRLGNQNYHEQKTWQKPWKKPKKKNYEPWK